MREDRSVMDLLNADYTFVNERLARHYGIPNIYGSRFRRVPVPNEARRGLLGQASILTVTSYPNRTSPVERGKWILTNLLGVPPQPPPPNIPPRPEGGTEGKNVSLRERMERHRANPVSKAFRYSSMMSSSDEVEPTLAKEISRVPSRLEINI